MPNLPGLLHRFGDANLYLAFFVWPGRSGSCPRPARRVRRESPTRLSDFVRCDVLSQGRPLSNPKLARIHPSSVNSRVITE
jgi:hypothetical protein